jgi:hypothetical protein
MAVGGDIKEITYNHPTLGSGSVLPKSGEDSTYDTGGYRSDDDENGIDGGGNMIDIMKQVRPYFEAVVANDMNVDGTLEKMVALAASPVPAQWTISIVNGVTYGMTGKPVGPLQGEISKATFKLKVAGGGKMKKQ